METTQQVKNGIRKAKEVADTAEERFETAETAIKQRVSDARDIAVDLRERAELAIKEKPYLLPAACGALGFGVGVLVGSKLSRLVLITAAGALLSEPIRNSIKKIGQDFARDVGIEIDDAAEDVEEEGEPSVA